MTNSQQGIESWKEETTAFDRVVSVATTVSKPRSAGWIADEAAVAPATAHNHLNRLVNLYILREVAGDESTLYEPDPLYLRMQMMCDLLEEYDHEGLIDLKQRQQEQIAQWKDEYEVNTPGELRELIAQTDEVTETRELRKTVSDWELVASKLSVVEEAIERYDTYSHPPERDD